MPQPPRFPLGRWLSAQAGVLGRAHPDRPRPRPHHRHGHISPRWHVQEERVRRHSDGRCAMPVAEVLDLLRGSADGQLRRAVTGESWPDLGHAPWARGNGCAGSTACRRSVCRLAPEDAENAYVPGFPGGRIGIITPVESRLRPCRLPRFCPTRWALRWSATSHAFEDCAPPPFTTVCQCPWPARACGPRPPVNGSVRG